MGKLRFMYLWQSSKWPAFVWDAQAMLPPLARARLAQGRMLGRAASLQLLDQHELQLAEWANEALATAQIEGEALQLNSVRASAARRLGLEGSGPVARDARTEATLDVLQAAVQEWQPPLKHEALWDWHAALFPTGRSGVTRIVTGSYRSHVEPMQIGTARMGKPDVVHYQAPASADVPAMMDGFIAWFNASRTQVDGLVRAALAHLWFETIHPFEDGNGRIGRALAELALAQDMQSSLRLFSLSQQLSLDRAGYYDQLQAATGRASMDVTTWVGWLVERIEQACLASLAQMETALAKSRFWDRVNAAHAQLSASQRKVIGRLFDAGPGRFVGGMSTEKYVHLAGVSRATAYRKLTELTALGLLVKTGQGRGTRYQLGETYNLP